MPEYRVQLGLLYMLNVVILLFVHFLCVFLVA
jgi:hypothetical protein